MAQRKRTIDEAWPGDIVGLPDNGIFKIGDTLTEGEQIHFRGLPSFSPEMFKYIENADPMKTKQPNKGAIPLLRCCGFIGSAFSIYLNVSGEKEGRSRK